MTKNICRIIQHVFATRVSFGEVVYGPESTLGPKQHKGYMLLLMIQGDALINLNGHDHILPAGQVALLRPKDREFHQFSRNGESQLSWCSIDPPLVVPDLRRELRAAPFQWPISENLNQLITMGLRAGAREEDAALLRQLALAALSTFTHDARVTGNRPAFPEALLRARDLMETRYGDKLTLGEVAKHAGLSSTHLIKLFRRHLHETPVRYLWRLRVDHGVRLLRETGLSVSEISYRTGFRNPFHFSELVKRRHQLSPRNLRQQWWGRADE